MDAQADPSLRWAHSHFVSFVMRRLIFIFTLDTLFIFAGVTSILVGDGVTEEVVSEGLRQFEDDSQRRHRTDL